MVPLGLTRIYREVELPLVPVLARIECWGIRLDCNLPSPTRQRGGDGHRGT